MILKERLRASNKCGWLRSKYQVLKQSLMESDGGYYYSLFGEDMVLARLFDGIRNGFYVDVGAHHPTRFSNTYYFYLRGWRGINIEPNPDAMLLFQKKRSRDINLCMGVSNGNGLIPYWKFNESALNTCSGERMKLDLEVPEHKLIGKELVPVERLESIFSRYVSNGTEIGFMNVDVEGFELSVLKSNDWSKWQPKVIVVEDALGDGVAREYLHDLGYRDHVCCGVSCILVRV